jgi:ABC-type phosphate/phosphonate transport system substrate-binding protein
LLLIAMPLLVALAVWAGSVEGGEPPEPLRIGVSHTLFADVPDLLIKAALAPLRALIENQTGQKADFAMMKDTDKLAEDLSNGKLTVAVFPGYEFAWARAKHPQLNPLVIAVNQQADQRALVMVRSDSPAATFADLKNQTVALPRGVREHCRLFLERHCQSQCKETPRFFSEICSAPNDEEALDDVVDSTVHSAVVDGVAVDCYQKRKPGRFAQLKVLTKSESFPATVIAFRKGGLDDATLSRFRESLLSAKTTPRGRQVLQLTKLTAFEPVPKDYEKTLVAIGKAYPPPAEKK